MREQARDAGKPEKIYKNKKYLDFAVSGKCWQQFYGSINEGQHEAGVINLFTDIWILLVLPLFVRVTEAESEGVNVTRLLLVNRPSLNCLQISFHEIRLLFVHPAC